MLTFNQIILGIFVFFPFIVLIHELGHVFFGKLLDMKILSVTIGSGPTIFKFKNLKVKLIYFFYGFTEYEGISLDLNKKIIFLLGGIIFNILSIFILTFLIKFNILDEYIFTPFITFSESAIILAVLPLKYSDNCMSDVLQIYNSIKHKKINK